MPCPYSVAKQMITYIHDVLAKPSAEYGGFAVCPFAEPELRSRRLMLAELTPSSDTNLVNIIREFSASKYKSLLIAQHFEQEQTLSAQETKQYQKFINLLLDRMGLHEYKCICFNPNDKIPVRQQAPYFLINIAERTVLAKAHTKLMKTDYFAYMSNEYLNFLHVDPKKVTRKVGS